VVDVTLYESDLEAAEIPKPNMYAKGSMVSGDYI
jgi:hypothetical protein